MASEPIINDAFGAFPLPNRASVQNGGQGLAIRRKGESIRAQLGEVVQFSAGLEVPNSHAVRATGGQKLSIRRKLEVIDPILVPRQSVERFRRGGIAHANDGIEFSFGKNRERRVSKQFSVRGKVGSAPRIGFVPRRIPRNAAYGC